MLFSRFCCIAADAVWLVSRVQIRFTQICARLAKACDDSIRSCWVYLPIDLVPLAGIEPALLSELDFESGVKHHNILIILNYISLHCASVLINVLI
jgi:hypothetical protein